MKKIIISSIASLVLIYSSIVLATTIVPTTFEKMTKKSGRIFYGKCTDVKVAKDENGMLATYVTYDVIRSVKGVDSDKVTFKVFGAATNNGDAENTTIRGMTTFSKGKEEILFLYEDSRWGFTSPIGLWQGVFGVKKTDKGVFVNTGSKAFKSTKGINIKAATDGSGISSNGKKEEKITTDQFLDRVEKLLIHDS